MIIVIDDRQERQGNFLKRASVDKSDQIEIWTGDKIDVVAMQLERRARLGFPPKSIVCIHYSFGPLAFHKEHFEKCCKNNSSPIIYFSGGNRMANTTKKGLIYTAGVRYFYRRLNEVVLTNEERFITNPAFFLFGEAYILNELLTLRRKLYVFQSQDRLEELLDDPSYTSEEAESAIQACGKAGHDSAVEWLRIINEKIKSCLQ